MCIDAQMLSAYLDGELGEPYRTQVQEHLSYCAACKTRLEGMKALDDRLQDAKFPEEALTRKKDAIYSMLEKKYFAPNSKKISFFRRKVEMTLPTMITAAAALTFIFVGGFMFFGTSPSQTDEILPSFAVQADSSNVRYVSSQKDSLDSYTLEEILQYLDGKGYQVDISIKGLQPLKTE